jgi:hypothetical protein
MLIKKKAIEDIRSMRGRNMDSDHLLQKVVFKQKLLTIYRRKPYDPKKGIKQIYKIQ